MIEKNHVYSFYGSPTVGAVKVTATETYRKVHCFAGYYMNCEEDSFTVEVKDLPNLIEIFQDILAENKKLKEEQNEIFC